MRKLSFVVVLVLALPLFSAAQILPGGAVFGGYTYVRAAHNGGAGFNLNGWDASLEGKSSSWLGWVADISQQYGSPAGAQEKQTSALFGPQVSIPHLPRVVPFAHVLIGAVHGTNQLVFPNGIVCLRGSPCRPSISTGTAFATAVGGGVDVKVVGPLWVRAIQADDLHANLSPDHHNELRLAFGIVLRWGR